MEIEGWRWKSADICEKEHARQVCGISRRHADGECAKRYTSSRTTARAAMSSRGVAPVRDSACAAAFSPRRRGYAAKIMRRKNARREFGKQATGKSYYRNPCGITTTYGIRQCGDGCSSPFFHYYNIIVTFLICRGFSIAPRKPRNTGVPACQVRLFYIASAGLDKYFVRWYNICAKEQMFVLARGVYPNHRPVSPGGYFNRKTEQMFD